MAAHTYAYRDHNRLRAMEEWYEYQRYRVYHRISKNNAMRNASLGVVVYKIKSDDRQHS